MGVQKAKRLFQKNGVCLQKKQKVFVKEVQKAKLIKKNYVFFERDALLFEDKAKRFFSNALPCASCTVTKIDDFCSVAQVHAWQGNQRVLKELKDLKEAVF